MSKIYDKYLELKNEDSTKLYLFRSGKFYIFLGDDVDFINEYVVLKKVKFSNETYKCGFPDAVLDQYLKVFKNHNLDVVVVENYDLKKDNNNLYDFIKSIDINNITPIDALNKLSIIKEMVSNGKEY